MKNMNTLLLKVENITALENGRMSIDHNEWDSLRIMNTSQSVRPAGSKRRPLTSILRFKGPPNDTLWRLRKAAWLSRTVCSCIGFEYANREKPKKYPARSLIYWPKKLKQFPFSSFMNGKKVIPTHQMTLMNSFSCWSAVERLLSITKMDSRYSGMAWPPWMGTLLIKTSLVE